jgi:hypothetical protein
MDIWVALLQKTLGSIYDSIRDPLSIAQSNPVINKKSKVFNPESALTL